MPRPVLLLLVLAAAPLAGCAGLAPDDPHARVVLVSTSEFVGHGAWRYVHGEVENLGPQPAEDVEVVWRWSDGTSRGQDWDSARIPGVLAVGERAAFWFKFDPERSSPRIEILARGTWEAPRLADALIPLDVRLDAENGSRSLRGDLVNTGPTWMQAGLDVHYRNATGGLVATADGVTDVRLHPEGLLLAPGSRIAWVAPVPDGAPEWTQWDVRVRAQPAGPPSRG